MESYPMTKDGHTKLENELKTLKTVHRPEVIEAIAVAREHGDLKENAEYHAAREQQGHIEDRIVKLENVLANAKVVDVKSIKSKTVVFGATVKIVNEDTDEENTYQIVGEFESDLEKKKISNVSPIGRALFGKEKGDSIEVDTPSGTRYYEILSIRYK